MPSLLTYSSISSKTEWMTSLEGGVIVNPKDVVSRSFGKFVLVRTPLPARIIDLEFECEVTGE